MVQEAVAFAGRHDWNGRVPGPLDTLGDSAARLAGRGGDDGTAWDVAAQIAYTESPSLIEANLDTPEKREHAFDVLNQYLAESRDEWSLAADEDSGYSLLRAPEANDGITRLLATNPEIIDAKLEEGAQGEADLVQLFESISLNPYVPQRMRDRVTRAVDGYVQEQLASVDAGNASQVGERLGRLLGTLQVAANRAVDGAEGDERSRVEAAAVNVLGTITGGLVEAGLAATTGPLGAIIGGAIAQEVIGQVFGSDVEPTRDEIERAVFEQLERAGIDVSAGEAGADSLNETLNATYDALNVRLQTATGAEREQIQNQMAIVQGLINGFDTFGDTLDSNEGGGQLAEELNERDDDANLS